MDSNTSVREQILLAVEELISSRGVNSFSLRDIANVLNISTGTLYYHFKTKDDIILAVTQKHFKKLGEDYDDWLNRHKAKGDLTKERFVEVVVYKGTELFNRSKIHMYLVNECMRDDSKLKNEYNKLLNEWIEKVIDGVKQVYGDSEDCRAIGYLISLVVEGMTIRVVLNDRHEKEENAVKKLLEEI